MNKKPTVSVVVPCYNVEKTIEDTLNSLAKQVFLDFEVILIDDGSTDSTKKVIMDISKEKTINLSYYYQKNSGVSVARNFGISKAKGKYICFIDSDDIYSPFYLDELVHAILRYDSDTAYCSFTRDLQDLDGNQYKELVKMDHMNLMENFMLRTVPTSFWCFIYKKEIIEKNKITFPVDKRYGEDNEFIWKYLSHCQKGVLVNKRLYYYRDNPYSVTNKVSWFMTDSLKTNPRIKEYLILNGDPFYEKYDSYSTGRAYWSLARTYAIKRNKSLYKKLVTVYEAELKEAMNRMVKSDQILIVKITALTYLVSPKSFYCIISTFGYVLEKYHSD